MTNRTYSLGFRLGNGMMAVASLAVLVVALCAQRSLAATVAEATWDGGTAGTVTATDLDALTTGGTWSLNGTRGANYTIEDDTGGDGDKAFRCDDASGGDGGSLDFATLTLDSPVSISGGNQLTVTLEIAARRTGGGKTHDIKLLDGTDTSAVSFSWWNSGEVRINGTDPGAKVGPPLSVDPWDSTHARNYLLTITFNGDGTLDGSFGPRTFSGVSVLNSVTSIAKLRLESGGSSTAAKGTHWNDIVLEAVIAGEPAIELSADTVTEHTTIGAFIGSLSMLNTNGTFTYSLPNGALDNALFALTGTDNSNLVTDAIFDYETDSAYDIRVVATKGTDTVTNDFEITIANALDPAVALSSQDVDEGEPIGTVVGSLSTTNPVGAYTYAYSFGGGADDGSFTIDGTDLRTAEIFDDSVKNSYAIKLVSTIQEGGVSGDGPGAGPFTNDFTISVNSTSPPSGVIQIDFGRDNQSPKIGFVSGGNWNTIHTGPHAEADAAVGDTYELRATNGPPSGITIGGWMGTFGSTSSNNQDGDSFTGTAFQDAGYDVLWAATAGDAVGFTLSGFGAGEIVSVRLAAAAGAGGNPNVADFTFAGSFGGSNQGDNFNVYANSQASSGAGTELTWTLFGSTSYAFVMDTDTGNGAINGMIITVTNPTQGTLFIIR